MVKKIIGGVMVLSVFGGLIWAISTVMPLVEVLATLGAAIVASAILIGGIILLCTEDDD